YFYLRFKFRWLSGPYQSDIFNDIALFYLWSAAGLTNVFPLFKRLDIECIGVGFNGQ
ncbi:457_t:CDS:2, partial [Entrophospora sp. SA101]